MNETTTGAPLTATLGERLGEDPHVREVREGVARASGEPGAQAREGLGKARGGRGEGRRAGHTSGGRGAGRPFPWGALALAVVGWAAITGMGRVLRRNVRRAGAGVASLARRVPVG